MNYTFSKNPIDAGELEARFASEVGLKPEFVTITEEGLSVAFPEPLSKQAKDKLRQVVRNLRPDLNLEEGS